MAFSGHKVHFFSFFFLPVSIYLPQAISTLLFPCAHQLNTLMLLKHMSIFILITVNLRDYDLILFLKVTYPTKYCGGYCMGSALGIAQTTHFLLLLFFIGL